MRVRIICATLLAAVPFGAVARAQSPVDAVETPGAAAPASSSAVTASSSSPPLPAPAPVDPRIARVRGLIAGTLDVQIDPQTLFDAPLDDEAAVLVDATRLRALLGAVDAAAAPAHSRGGGGRGQSSEPAAGGTAVAGGGTTTGSVDPVLFKERVELDRARLEFYSLDHDQRAELLRVHAARQEAARPRETEEERRNREAEADRSRALEAARVARSEAERLIGQEVARLVALESKVRDVRENRFREARAQLAMRHEAVLGWQRRVREAKAAGHDHCDEMYDALRRSLRSARDELASELDAQAEDLSEVPALGPDPLLDVPPDITTEAARQRRRRVEQAIALARSDERALRDERASALLDEIDTLNRERLGLLGYLSPEKRAAITGFASAAWDQAKSEARHLSLILRYHQHVAQAWVADIRQRRLGSVWHYRRAGVAALVAAIFAVFFWARRRTHALLRLVEQRLYQADRDQHRLRPSFARRSAQFLLKVHRPLEWSLCFSVMYAVLPVDARRLLEVELAVSAIGFMLAGALVVDCIDAFAAAGGNVPYVQDEEVQKLRLRSLRLVGRTVVGFTLVLVLSARLVGRGTIHSWVLSSCWFAAIPLILLLVRWWRGVIFGRLERIRKKTPLQAWVLARRTGWRSFAAAMLGAVELLASGAWKLLRGWGSRFESVRRVHAYLFRREIERLRGERVHQDRAPLPAALLAELDPERPLDGWLTCPADELLDALVGDRYRGRVVLVVGARGMGKSSLLRAAAARLEDSAFVECTPATTLADVRRAAAEGNLTSANLPRAILLDDVHRLVQPRVGGFARFDELMAFARADAPNVTWALSVDASMWPLLRLARDFVPLFDAIHVLSPWTEGQIGTLLGQRCEQVGIAASYDDLVDDLPPGADELDRLDALEAKRAGYQRMLWDHAAGNPGQALQAWRASLLQDPAGGIHVRTLQVPDVAFLDRLPDSSLFVLKAVLQTAPAAVETVARVTRMPPNEVSQNFRIGCAQGLFEERDGGVRVTWAWIREVTRLLERRHLLVNE